ncbi:MAG: hypothetical protein ACO3NE_12445 [Alphaproteobacteria bacterium]
MRSRYKLGLNTSLVLTVLLIWLAPIAKAQDAPLDEQVLLELRQLRSEVDFLRSQVETGGGVADVRFDDLQRRIDKVLEDAAALATEASTAQRRAETAVQRVEELEKQVSIMQAGIDKVATRLAQLEADAVFAEPAETTEIAEPEVAVAASAEGQGAEETQVETAVVDDDGVEVPLPKDRTETEPPAREVTAEVEIADAEATIVELPQASVPGLVAVEGAAPLVGELPIFPAARPNAPARSILASADTATATNNNDDSVSGTFGGLTTDTATQSGRSSSASSAFNEGMQAFDAGDYVDAIASLQPLFDENGFGARAPEGHYLLGTAYQRVNRHAAAIQVLALGLRRYPTSDFAATSLVNLAIALNANDQKTESCRLLSFVPLEYPEEAQAITSANARAVEFGC